MPPVRHGLALLIAAALITPASAVAAPSGGASAPPASPSGGNGTSGGGGSGTSGGGSAPSGAAPGGAEPRSRSAPKSSPLTLTSFSLNGSRFYEYGRGIRVGFQLSGARGSAKLSLVFVSGGRRVKVVPLGDRAAGIGHSHTVPVEGLPSGPIEVRISGRDSRGRAIKSGPQAASSRAIDVRSHRFPVVGPHAFGGEGSKFGADRDGGKRKHQGQDVSAAEGTPMVAVRGGVVRFTGNQPSGAGVYVVIQGVAESRDYVYMHLVEGSLLVRKGQAVRTGQLIGKVGNTGSSSGAHLHFEIWQGVWQGGGTPIDPLPLLQRWDVWS